MKLLQTLAALMVYFCVATLMAQGLMVGYLAGQGYLTRDKLAQMAAVAQGINPFPEKTEHSEDEPNIDINALMEARALKFRELENLKLSLQQRAVQLAAQQRKLQDDKEIYDRSLKIFNQRIEEWETGELAQALDTAVITYGDMKPAQAKDQLIRMWDDKETDWVVRLMTALPPAKRAKIIAEFKDEQAGEPEILAEILRLMRERQPDIQIASDTRASLAADAATP